MKVELKGRDGGIISPARRQLLSTLWPAPSTMSLYCVKVSLKLRADAAITPIYAQDINVGKNYTSCMPKCHLKYLNNIRCLSS